MTESTPMKSRLAFISKGELFVSSDGSPLRSINSAFMLDAEKRDAKSRAVNGWKDETSMWGSSWMAPQMSQFQNAGAQRKKIMFTNVTRDIDGNFAYSLGLPGGGGLFRFDCERNLERRLMHRNSFFPTGLTARASDGLLAFSCQEVDGSSSIVIGERDGLQHRRITGGDSRDESPCWWNDGTHDWIYFHSTGIARSAEGIMLDMGPASICRVRLDGGDVETLLDSKDYDYLQPRMRQDGTLLCIRRPYQPSRRNNADPWTILKDILFFPFRLARAAFYFANFISVMFSGKSLASNEIKPAQNEKLERLILWGRMVDTQKAIKEAGRSGYQRLAPNDWQLVQVPKGSQTPEPLATAVLCFDLSREGTIYYSDGGRLYELPTSLDEASRLKATSALPLLEQPAIIQIAALD